MREPVHLFDERRRDVPAVMVCCSYTGEQVREQARSGDPMFAETATMRHLTTVDLPTGHWPMWSRPADLARIIATATAGDEPAQVNRGASAMGVAWVARPGAASPSSERWVARGREWAGASSIASTPRPGVQ